MKPLDTRDPEHIAQVEKLLAGGGDAKNLAACDCLMEYLAHRLADKSRRERVKVLRALLETVLVAGSDDPDLDRELLAAREYLGWFSHSYDDVEKAAIWAKLSVDASLGAGAAESLRQAQADELLSRVSVREYFVGLRLRPRHGLSDRAVRPKRRLIAKAVLQAVSDFLEDAAQFDDLISTVLADPGESVESRAGQPPQAVRTSENSTPTDSLETLFTAIESETLFVIGANGARTIYTNRRIRSEKDQLEEFEDFFSGSGDSSIEYHFVTEYGCDADELSQVRDDEGHLGATFRLSRSLPKGTEHTIRYRIERLDPDDMRPEGRTFVLSSYADDSPTLRERMLVRFDKRALPARVWWQVVSSLTRIRKEWNADHNLLIDSQGCVEWEPPEFKSNMLYVVCWEF